MDSVLRPRDIQARIRSGESPESVAAAAQTTVEKIIGFATPVLAERAYIAEQAQKASVRRRAGDGPIGNLGAAVAERLEADDIDPDTVEWDAWRREDGRWTLVASYRGGAGPLRAHFAYDQAGRYVVAEDDESRRLVGERSATAPREQQLPLGEDAIEVVTGRRPAEVTDLARAREPREPVEPLEPPAPEQVRTAPPSADWISTQASDRPEPVEALFDASDLETGPETSPETSPEPEPESADKAEEPAAVKPKKTARSRTRASVPSWDEIMFGSNRGE